MHRSEVLCFVFFFANLLIFFFLDDSPNLLFYVSLGFAGLSVVPLIFYGISPESIPFMLYVFCAVLITTLGFASQRFRSFFTLMPLVFLTGMISVFQRLKIIGAVLIQSLWLFVSMILLYYFFGVIGSIVFSENTEYFWSEKSASLTFLQMSTLDQVGKIARLNYSSDGFVKSFFTIVVSLVLIHSLININTAFVLKYISEMHIGAPVQAMSSHFDITGDHLSRPIRMMRTVARIAGVCVIFMPFMYDLKPIYLSTSLLSTILILLDDLFKKKFDKKLQLANFGLQIGVIATFILNQDLANYILCLIRIFLIPEITKLFLKVKRSVSTVTQLCAMTLFSFILFSIFIYLHEAQKGHSTSHQEIYLSAISSLQFLVLDDWTKTLRIHSWYVAVAVVLYVVLLNHLLMNMLMAEVFSNTGSKDQQTENNKNSIKPQFQFINAKDSPVQHDGEAERFLDIIRELKYSSD